MKCNIICHTDSPDWLERRREGITATDTAKIMGMTPYGTQVDVYLDKLGILPEIEDNEAMYWGRKHEANVLSELPLRRPNVKHVEPSGMLIASKEHPFMIATLDGLGEEHGGLIVVVEAKASDNAKMWQDGPPDAYVLQLQKQLYVTGCERGYLCVLIGMSDYRVYEFARDEELIQMIIKAESDFWFNHVVPRVMPDITPLDTNAAKHLYPKALEDIAILPEELGEVCRVALKARAFAKIAEQAKDWADNRLKMALREFKSGVVENYKLSWSNVETTAFDSKAFKADHPDLYSLYTKVRHSRRFTIKEQDDNGENNRRLEEQATRAISAELGIDEGHVLLVEDQSGRETSH